LKGTQDILNIQPLIRFHLTEDWNLITRTIFPLTWQRSRRQTIYRLLKELLRESIDAHAELDAAVGRHVGVSARHLALYLDATVMFLNLGISQFAPERLEACKGAFFVLPVGASTPPRRR
jgi:hypothetical protein